MSLDRKSAALALHRFGLGPRRGSIAAIASDPRGALLAELDRPDIGQIAGANLMDSAHAVRAAFEFRAERRAAQIVAKREADERQRAMGMAESDKTTTPAEAEAAPKPNERNVVRDIFRAEAGARFAAGLSAEFGFAERLVWFWSNHFCVSSEGAELRRELRARGDPGASARPLRRHAAGRRKPSGHAVLSR
jgi:uncharacterized protein (DUF1800 family)